MTESPYKRFSAVPRTLTSCDVFWILTAHAQEKLPKGFAAVGAGKRAETAPRVGDSASVTDALRDDVCLAFRWVLPCPVRGSAPMFSKEREVGVWLCVCVEGWKGVPPAG